MAIVRDLYQTLFCAALFARYADKDCAKLTWAALRPTMRPK